MTLPVALMIMAAGLLWSACIAGADGMFYRITSTQQTEIVSFDAAGNIEWTNTITPAVCGVERTPRQASLWVPFLDPVVVTENTSRVVLPLSASVPVAQQKFLFEVNHVGGWAFGHGGFYVDNAGFVYTYYENRYFTDPTNGVFAASYLEDKTSTNRRYLATVLTAELENKWRLLSLAATGSVSNPRQVGNDAGVTEYRGFILNESSNEYSVILLGMQGDFEATNSSLEARILMDWLQTIEVGIPDRWFSY